MDWYCSALAGGGGDGSVGSPWTLAEGVTAWGDGTVGTSDTVWVKVDGVYTTAGIVLTGNGSIQKKILSGYTTVIGDGGKATIQRSGGAGILVDFRSLYARIENFVIDGQDGGTDNLCLFNYSICRNIESHNAGAIGIDITSSGSAINCYAHDNGTIGIDTLLNSTIVNCITKDNGSYGMIVSKSDAVNCISKGNTGYNFFVSIAACYNCVSDGGSDHGFFCVYPGPIANCVAINSPVGKHAFFVSTGGSLAINCDFFNNDSDTNEPTLNIDGQTLDPQFKDPANLDYTRTGTNLDDLGLSEVGMVAAADYNIDIGPDQKPGPDLPAVGKVVKPTVYDYGNKVGTYEPALEDYYRYGEKFGEDGVEFEGDDVLPAEGDVRVLTGYGADGVEFEGELIAVVVESPVELSVADDRVILEVADG